VVADRALLRFLAAWAGPLSHGPVTVHQRLVTVGAGLNAEEAIAGNEQAHLDTHVRRGLAWLGDAIACLAFWLADGTRWTFRRAAILCLVVRWRFSGRGGRISVAPAWYRPTTGRP
jgi:hypothetical protein